MSGGSFRKFGTDSYGIGGTGSPALPSSWASAGDANATSAAVSHIFMQCLPWYSWFEETSLIGSPGRFERHARRDPLRQRYAGLRLPQLSRFRGGAAELGNHDRAGPLHLRTVVRGKWLRQNA